MIYKKEIEAEFGDKIIIELLNNKKDKKLSIGILLQIENIFYELNDSNFTALLNDEVICDDYIEININDTYIKNISYCYIKNSNESIINILLPLRMYYNNRLLEETDNYTEYAEYTGICHESCLQCNGPNPNNCTSCSNSQQYYLVEGKNICIKLEEKPNNYFLDSDNIIKKCHENCFSCYGIGNDDNNNCTECKVGFFFDKVNPAICVTNDCPIGCYKCNITNYERGIISQDKICTDCKNNYNYFPLQKIKSDQFYVRCYSKDEPPKGYYLVGQVYKPCYETCAKCNTTGNNIIHSCVSCEENYIFIDEEPSNVKDKIK